MKCIETFCNPASIGSSPISASILGVAQPGSALALGARSRKFESCRRDHFNI